MEAWSDAFTARSIGYSLLVGAGLLAAGAVAYGLPVGAPERKKFLLIPAGLGLIVGAKIPVLMSYGWDNPAAYMGKSLLGGLLGAYLAVRLTKWVRGIPWVGGGDAFVLPVAIGAAFGRVGCLIGGCCWGRNGFPAPVLEIAFHLTMFAVVLGWRRENRHGGRWFPLYMLSYCLFRFCTEFIRTEPRVLSGLTAYQWIAALGALVFAAELHYRSRQGEGLAGERNPVG